MSDMAFLRCIHTHLHRDLSKEVWMEWLQSYHSLLLLFFFLLFNSFFEFCFNLNEEAD